MSRPVVACPLCGTRFRVGAEQFEVAAGRVRCGACYGVFDGPAAIVRDAAVAGETVAAEAVAADQGNAVLADDVPAPAAAPEAAAAAPDDAVEAPEKFVADSPGGAARLPRWHAEDVIPAVATVGVDDAGEAAEARSEPPDGDLVGVDVPVAVGTGAVARVPADTDPAPSPATAGSFGRARRRSVLGAASDELAPLTATDRARLERIGFAPPEFDPPPRRAGGILLVAVLAVTLVAQIVFWRGPTWAQDAGLRPYCARFCALVGCTLSVYRDPRALHARSLVLRDDPQRAGVWLIDVILANDAPFPQPFPRLLVEFTDRGGEPVAGRVFAPKEYLGGELADAETMPPVRPIQVQLAILRPPEAVNYQLELVP